MPISLSFAQRNDEDICINELTLFVGGLIGKGVGGRVGRRVGFVENNNNH